MVERLTDLLKKRKISIYKIIIFGSYVKGLLKEDSDIDIIIVSKDFRDKDLFERAELMAGLNRELIRLTGRPFDIFYYSDEEWEEGHSLIINAAKKAGEVIEGWKN